MDWKEIGQNIVKFAPAIGGAFLGPGGAAGGMAIKALAGAFGLTEDETTPEKINALINSDPQFALKAKIADNDLTAKMRELDIDELRAELADVQSARSREVEITKATGKRDVNLYVLAWTVVIGFFILTIVLMNKALPSGSNDVVFLLFGGLVAGFTQVLGYFFGSSKSSSDKTALMARKD